MFDPWIANHDEVLEAEKSFVGNGIADPSAPIYQWSAAHRIKKFELQKDKMDGFDVLACIRICLNHDLVAPYWLSIEFIKRYDAVLTCKAKSWDDDMVFGKPYRKGTNINALEKKRKFKSCGLSTSKVSSERQAD